MQLGGINFEYDQPGMVMRRIVVQQVGNFVSYLGLLKQDRAEVLALSRELLIPVPRFFRDGEAFEALAIQAIAPLVAGKDAGETLRIWCAGMSTGEDAYSIAMLCLEAFEHAKRWPALKIFADDVEQLNIEAASMGRYPGSTVAEVSAQQLECFFVKKGNRFVVKNDLRQCIVSARHNLLADPPFIKMDGVVCRNALICFRNVAQEKALRRMQYAPGHKGYLFLGSSESPGDRQRDFQTLSVRYKLWQVTRATGLPLEMAGSSGGAQALADSPLRHRPQAAITGWRLAPFG